jgi:DNA (cytosine-5)-methyltransferase 1
MTHLSLFTGIGGIDLAAEWAGFETVAMVERDKFCQQVLAKRFPNVPIYDDVTIFDGYKYEKEIDLLSAGFPCQPHSLAGKRKASSDERDLWGEVVRILGEAKPRFFLGENVPGLLTSESGRFFGRILNDLESLGYRVGWATYGAKDIGAVHRRNRVFIVAYSKNLFCNGSSYQSSVSPLSEFRDGDCSRVVVYSSSEPRLQANTTIISKRGERDSWDNVNRSYWKRDATNSNGTRCEEQWGNISNESEHNPIKHGAYKSIKTGDWRQWGINPTVRLESRVCGGNDGVPNRVDRLKALGNAVVPQQVYPILVEIAKHLQTFDNQA